MPWYFPFPWSDAIKKRACRYLLQRYLGQFLQEKITLDQLSLNLYSGNGLIKDLLLDAVLVNETFESANLPLEMVDGFIGSVSFEIPWSALLSESSHVEIQGLEVTLRPKQVAEKTHMLDSMWGSMTKSSMQLAEECLKDEERSKRSGNQFEGLEKFAQAIDIVLTRIKVNFTDIVIRLEQVQNASKSRAVALEVRIKRVNYFDEASTESTFSEDVNYQPLPVANKCFHVEGVTFYTDEYMYPATNSGANTSTTASTTILEGSEMYFSTREGTEHLAENLSNEVIGGTSLHKHNSNNLVQIAVCHGITEIRLKVKQNTDVSGPKFELDGHIGVLHAILWPKQCEMLRDLLAEIWIGRQQGDSKSKFEHQKLMTDSDYTKIERELQRDFDARQRQTVGGNNIDLSTWDQQANQDDEEFLAVGTHISLNEDGVHRSQPTSVPAYPLPSLDRPVEKKAVTLNTAKLRVRSLLVTFIEANPDFSALIPNFPFTELQRCSTEHFASLSDLNNVDFQDTVVLRDRFARSAPMDHFWFFASTVLLECLEKRSASMLTQSVKASMANLEAWEHLFDSSESSNSHHADSLLRLKTMPLCTELLTFPLRKPEDRFSFSPCVAFELESVEKEMLHTASPGSKFEIRVDLQPCKMDADITIIDRVATLLKACNLPEPKFETQPSRWASEAVADRAERTVPRKFALRCPSVTAQLRFPVLDLRPFSDRNRWGQRALHKESVVVELVGIDVQTSFGGEQAKRVDVECRSLTASFQLTPDERPFHFLRAVMDVDYSIEERRREEFAECIRLSVYIKKFSPNMVTTDILLDGVSTINFNQSLEASFEDVRKDPSLFATSRNMVDHEEINCVIPSPAAEASLFRENVVSNSRLVLEITIPHVTAFIPDKKILEILYNRINTDLLLWEPSEGKPASELVPLSAAHLMFREPSQLGESHSATNTFELCKNTAVDESEDDDCYSFEREESRRRTVDLIAAGVQRHRAKIPSDVCVVLNIGKAGIGAKVEHAVRGKAALLREAWVELDSCSIFSVSGYRGQPEIRYSSIRVQKLALYYGDHVPHTSSKSEGDHFLTMLNRPVHLLPIALPLSQDLMIPSSTTSVDLSSDDEQMLDVAIAIHVDTFRNIKDVKVALEFCAIKLHHRVTLPEDLWLTQVMEYLNLKDFPVLGYNSPTIITEFHVTTSNCAVDYRPLFLPVKSLLTLDRVNLSSTIVADSPQQLLRVIAQDLRVHLSKKKQPICLKEDYVCVVDVPFVEFQIKLNDRENPARSASPVDSMCSNPQENVTDEMMDAMQESPPRKNSHTKPHLSIPPPSMSISITPATAATCSSLKTSLSEGYEMDDDDFCIIEEDLGVGILPKGGEPGIKFLSLEPIRIVENHFSLPLAVTDQLTSPDGYPCPVVRLTLKEMSVIWSMYGGKDFEDKFVSNSLRKLGPQNRMNSAPANLGKIRSSSSKLERSDSSAHGPSWLIRGGVLRDHSVLMEIHLNKIKFQHEQYPFDGRTIQAARQVLFIQDFEIRDRMATSEINKFLYQHVSSSMPRQSHASMFSLRALHERPDPSLPMQECTLRIAMQPLRLNIDQESLFFLSDFFTEMSGTAGTTTISNTNDQKPLHTTVPVSPSSSSKDHFPVRTKRLESLEEEENLLQDPLIHFDDPPRSHLLTDADLDEVLNQSPSNTESDAPIFFKSVSFSPEVPILLDYHGKHVDMERVGALGGLLAGLATLNCTLLKLKSVHNRQGIRGIDRVILTFLTEWLTDIRKTQLANLLAGVGPMHCFVQLVQGIRDLFWLPVEQYRKDGRIVRGVQRGATAFTTSTLIATIELTNRIVQTVQVAAESAYDVISPGPSFRRKRRKSNQGYPKAQPGDIREGVVTAYQVLCEGFTDTAREIVDAVSEEHEHKGVSGAVGGALRQIAPAIVKPLILASQATSNVLGGLRNQLQPDFKQDEREKWRTEEDVKQRKFQNDDR